MATETTAAATMKQWAEPMPNLGPAVYRITDGPKEHKHSYHIVTPWSGDQSRFALTRYDRVDPKADVCVMDTGDGRMTCVGRSRQWTSHTGTFVQWQEANRVFYHSADDDGATIVTVNADGSDECVVSRRGLIATHCTPDGKWVYGATGREVHFPDDQIAPRDDKGIVRMDLRTGERELLLSIEETLDLLPDADKVRPYHLSAKMILVHRKLPRVMFHLTNTFWDRDGSEPRIRRLFTLNADGSSAAYLGRCHHHPIWHSIEDRVLANVKDFNDEVRLGLYRGDGKGMLEYIPQTNGSGHPSFSPDGHWICTDAAGESGEYIILCDSETGNARRLAHYTSPPGGGGYPSFKAVDERKPGETVMQALARGLAYSGETWQTQAHPAWSRDGSAIVFNFDDGEGSQVYMIDVEGA